MAWRGGGAREGPEGPPPADCRDHPASFLCHAAPAWWPRRGACLRRLIRARRGPAWPDRAPPPPPALPPRTWRAASGYGHGCAGRQPASPRAVCRGGGGGPAVARRPCIPARGVPRSHRQPNCTPPPASPRAACRGLPCTALVSQPKPCRARVGGALSGCNSAGRVPASQAGCRGFESRRPLQPRPTRDWPRPPSSSSPAGGLTGGRQRAGRTATAGVRGRLPSPARAARNHTGLVPTREVAPGRAAGGICLAWAGSPNPRRNPWSMFRKPSPHA